MEVHIHIYNLNCAKNTINPILFYDNYKIVLLAELLKQIYPKLVELHNYSSRNSFILKLNNWITINRKILQKLDLNQSIETLERLCKASPGAIELLLCQIKTKYDREKETRKLASVSKQEETAQNCKF